MNCLRESKGIFPVRFAQGSVLFLLLAGFPPIPDLGRLSLGCGTAEQQSAQGFSVKREQRPEIAVSPKGRGGGYG